jgi:prepilin-type N-terminal cleavage/methylation domain-containing protein
MEEFESGPIRGVRRARHLCKTKTTPLVSILTQQQKRSTGFTLVELLVAMAILLLILAVCSALTLTAQNLLNNGMERIDADSQARLFFDRITIDLESMVKRADVDYIVKDGNGTPTPNPETGNDSLAFFAKASGYFSASDQAPRKTLSLVAYRVNSQTFQLERLTKGIGWNTTLPTLPISSALPMVFLTTPAPAQGMQIYSTWALVAGFSGGVPNLNLGTDTDYQVLADGVFRFEYCYILRDGTYSNSPYIGTGKTLNGWKDVVALYVAIAVLDNRSRLVVAHGATNADLTTVTGMLKDFPLDSTQTYPPLSQWQAVINQSDFATTANLPVKVAPFVRIFARTIAINNFPPDQTL